MKTQARQKRHNRVRSRINGTAQRPRLVVFRGNKTVSAQLVDDAAATVLFTVTSQAKNGKPGNVEAARKVGTDLASQAKAKKVTEVVFDRAGYQYHGIVQVIAEAAREGGLKL